MNSQSVPRSTCAFVIDASYTTRYPKRNMGNNPSPVIKSHVLPKRSLQLHEMKLVALLISFASIAVAQTVPALPERLVALKGSYNAAIQRATAPITKTYITELEKLKSELVKKADLQGALAVDTEIKSVVKPDAFPVKGTAPSGSHTKRDFEKELVAHKWQFSDHVDGASKVKGDVTFKADGTAETSWGGKGTWEVTKDGVLRYPLSSKWECRFMRLDATTYEGVGTGTDALANNGKVRLKRTE